MSDPYEPDVEEIDVDPDDMPDDAEVVDEGELDPQDTYVEGDREAGH